MNLFVALCTIATLSLARASALEEYDHDVEDQDLEMDMELARDLEEYDGDDLDVELRQDSEERKKPRIHPYCVRTFHSGWGGQCVNWTGILHQHCDFIWNATEDTIKPKTICYNQDTYCCVDCYAQKQYDNCGRISGVVFPTRRECCDGDRSFKTMNSGCNCCGKCKPHRKYCSKKDGRFCVTKNGVSGVDSKCSNNYCIANGGRLKSKTCSGKHCFCCIGAANPDNC